MPIPVVCPGCSAKLNAPDGAAGKKVKCPRCQGAIVIPAPARFEVVEDEPAPPAKQAVPNDPASARPKAKAVLDEEDEGEEEEKPRKKGKKKKKRDDEEGGVSMARNIIGAVLLVTLLVIAGIVYYVKLGPQE